MNGCLNILQKTTGVTFPNKTCIFPVVYALIPTNSGKVNENFFAFICNDIMHITDLKETISTGTLKPWASRHLLGKVAFCVFILYACYLEK